MLYEIDIETHVQKYIAVVR